MDFYLIRTPRQKGLFYSESEHSDPLESAKSSVKEASLLDRLLARLESRPQKSAKLLRQFISVVRDGYFKLENAIDPMERVVKRLRWARELDLFSSAALDGEEAIRQWKTFLQGQKIKHTLWLAVDALVTLIAVLLTPILMPLPGPNVFFYYPLLRTLSHYFAMQSARRGLQIEIHAHPLQAVSNIEQLLQSLPLVEDEEQLEIVSRNLKLEGLPGFLKRYL